MDTEVLLMNKLVKTAAGVAIAAAVVLLAYALLTPEPTSGTTDHMGMNGHMAYSSGNVGLIALSIVIIVVALMVVVLWDEYEPLPPGMAPSRGLMTEPPETLVAQEPQGPDKIEQPPPTPDAVAGRNYLVLRLLTGDERTVFKSIMDSGGEALQKDLMAKNKMSNAKVSRVLDRLLQKGVIAKERFGSTNKIRIRPEQ